LFSFFEALMTTEIVLPTLEGIGRAAEVLRRGELVAFPTETVYGIGGDARSDEAVKKIYEAKGRPSGNPLIVHVKNVEAAREYVREWPEAAEKLAAKFWPGPLTMILPRGEKLSKLVSAGRETVAVRVPNHAVARGLLEAFDGPVAAPSANRSGFTSPVTAAHVYAELAGRVPLILDGGALRDDANALATDCVVGVESTVVDLSGRVPTILRPGAVTLEMIEAVTGCVKMIETVVSEGESAASPGMHSRHYAPRTAAYRFLRGEWERARAFAEGNGPAALITWDEGVSLGAPHQTILLPREGAGYARTIYAALREADGTGAKAILVLMPPAEAGMWVAVGDRLRRATEMLPGEKSAQTSRKSSE
jgi:L-threonylcarbamoyladenylate synthase